MVSPPPPPPTSKTSSPPPPSPKSLPPPPSPRIIISGGSSSSSSGSIGGSSSSPPPPKPVVYTSKLLNSSFKTKEDLQRAESKFRQEQARQQLVDYSARGGVSKLSGSGKVIPGTIIPTTTKKISGTNLPDLENQKSVAKDKKLYETLGVNQTKKINIDTTADTKNVPIDFDTIQRNREQAQDINLSRQILGSQLEMTATAGSVLFPVGAIAGNVFKASKLGSLVPKLGQAGRISPYADPLSKVVGQTVKSSPKLAVEGVKTVAKEISKRPTLRAGLSFGEALFLPDAYATITEFGTPKTGVSSKKQKVALETIQKNLEKSRELLAYEEITDSKEISAKDAFVQKTRGDLYLSGKTKEEVDAFINEQLAPTVLTAPEGYSYNGKKSISVPKEFVFEDTGLPTRTQTDTTYKPKEGVFRIETPFGGFTPFDVLPMATFDLASGGQFTEKIKTNTIKDLQERGFSKKEAEAEFNRLYFTQVQSRSVGELQGLFQIGIGEELLSSGAIKKSVDVGIKALGGAATKKQAAKLVTQKAVLPLFASGVVGGASSVVVGQRAMMQDINPVEVATGGVVGGIGASAIGTVIARFGITRPNVSKAIYAGASAIDPFEPIADTFTGVSRKIAGEPELLIPVITPSATPTPSPTPSPGNGKGRSPSVVVSPNVVPSPTANVTPTPVNVFTPTVTPTPTPTPTVTPESTFVPSPVSEPTPDYVFTPTPEPTPTPNPTPTPTPTPTVTATPTPTATFVPTFTAPFPFVPPVFDFSGVGQAKGRSKSRKRFFNELASASQLLTGFDSTGSFNAPKTFKKPRVTKTKKSKPMNFEDLSKQQFSGFKQQTGFDISKFIFEKPKTKKRRKR